MLSQLAHVLTQTMELLVQLPHGLEELLGNSGEPFVMPTVLPVLVVPLVIVVLPVLVVLLMLVAPLVLVVLLMLVVPLMLVAPLVLVVLLMLVVPLVLAVLPVLVVLLMLVAPLVLAVILVFLVLATLFATIARPVANHVEQRFFAPRPLLRVQTTRSEGFDHPHHSVATRAPIITTFGSRPLGSI